MRDDLLALMIPGVLIGRTRYYSALCGQTLMYDTNNLKVHELPTSTVLIEVLINM